MKKLFILLLVLFALTANVWCTDVTLGASQQTALPFNPTNIGNDRSFTVSVTNGSPTVTSVALFPSAIVGKAGFQVTIAGVQYVVAGVASTSSLTLTTNYAAATGSPTLVLHKYVLLRVYATQSFQPFGASYVVQAGALGSSNFFKEIAVSILNPGTGNVAYYPEFVLPATTDATITNQARYVFSFYRPDNSFLAFYMCGSLSELALPPTTPTSFTAICSFNSPGGVIPPNREVYTKQEIDTRFPSCTTNNLDYFATTGNAKSCLTVGTGLLISGNTISTTATGMIGGSNTQVQFNDGGVFGGDADFTWNKTTNALTITGTGQAAALGLGVAPDTATPFKVTQAAATSGSPALMTIIGGAHTTLDADTEATDVNFGLNRSVQFTAGVGTFALQRAVKFAAPTYRATSAETIITAVNVDLSSPVAGTNMTLTNSYAMRISPSSPAHNSILFDHQSSATGRYLDFQVNGTRVGQIKAAAAVTNLANFVFGDASLLTTETDGFVYYPSTAGVPAGTPTSFGSGVIPTVIDRTNSRFYGYISGVWTNLSGAGGGGTTINPTDNVIPYRANATTFNDSSWSVGTSLAASSAITARTTGAPTYFFRLITPADTGLTASTESVGAQIGGNASAATVTRQWATGGLATQRENLFVAPTYAFVGASLLTDAATVAITGAPIAGTNATITNQFSLWVQGGQTKLQGITPLVVVQSIGSSGSPNLITVTGALHTTLAADTETTDLNFNLNRSIQFTAGGAAFATQRAVRFQAGTYAFTSADTITDAINVEIDSPRAGTNATLTNSYALKLTMNANAHQGLWIDNPQASPTGNLMVLGIAGVKIVRFVPNNGDLNSVFSDGALGTGNTDGFIHYPSMAGVPVGTPTSYTGTVPTVVDTTNSRFYGYIGAAWVDLSKSPGGSDGNLQYRVNGNTFGGVAGSAVTTLGEVDLNNTARTSGGSTRYFRVRTPADTGLTADTESIGLQFSGNSSAATVTRQFTQAAGAFATQREIVAVAPTYAFTAGDTITDSATMAITGRPLAGTNATLTNTYALWVQSNGNDDDPAVRIDGALAANGTGAGLMVSGSATGGASGTDGRFRFGYFDSSGFFFPAMWGGTNAGSPSQTNFFFHYNQNSAEEAIFNGPGTSGTLSFRTNNNFTTPAIQVKSSTDGQIIGMNVAPASIAAQLHVASGAAGRIGLRVDSLANSTVDLATFNLNADDTSTLANLATLAANSNGTPANGFGQSTSYTLETTTTNDQLAARVDVLWSNATHASRTSDYVINTVNSATTQEAVRFTGNALPVWPNTVTAGGTTGNQTINKPSGTVNFAATATTLTVTNSLVTTSSIVFAVVRTNDTTAAIKNVVPSSGSFVITLTAAATAETSVGFFVINK